MPANATDPTIGSANGLVPSGKNITWVKVYLDICRHLASLCHSDLTIVGISVTVILQYSEYTECVETTGCIEWCVHKMYWNHQKE